MIYCVHIVTRTRKRNHTFMFTDRARADAFYESAKTNPKVIDHIMIGIPADEFVKYEDYLEPSQNVALGDDRPVRMRVKR